MADEKSCGDKYIASKEAYFIRNKIVERDLEHCRSLTPIQVDTILELSKEYKDDDNPLSLKVNVDASDALTGLKAIQREAKKATAALKELEEKKNNQKVLVVRTNMMLTKEDHERVQGRLQRDIEKGILMLDNMFGDYELIEGNIRAEVRRQ